MAVVDGSAKHCVVKGRSFFKSSMICAQRCVGTTSQTRIQRVCGYIDASKILTISSMVSVDAHPLSGFATESAGL